jgi:hypothetical protein
MKSLRHSIILANARADTNLGLSSFHATTGIIDAGYRSFH